MSLTINIDTHLPQTHSVTEAKDWLYEILKKNKRCVVHLQEVGKPRSILRKYKNSTPDTENLSVRDFLDGVLRELEEVTYGDQNPGEFKWHYKLHWNVNPDENRTSLMNTDTMLLWCDEFWVQVGDVDSRPPEDDIGKVGLPGKENWTQENRWKKATDKRYAVVPLKSKHDGVRKPRVISLSVHLPPPGNAKAGLNGEAQARVLKCILMHAMQLCEKHKCQGIIGGDFNMDANLPQTRTRVDEARDWCIATFPALSQLEVQVRFSLRLPSPLSTAAYVC